VGAGKKAMRGIIAAFLLLGWLGSVHAQELKRIDIVEYGLYTSKIDRTESAPGAAATKINMVSNVRHTESTTTVPAQLGSQFGVRYRLVGSGTDNVKLKVVWRIPSPGLHNPETGKTVTEDVSFWDRKIGSTNYNAYSFAHDWEIVSGIWTLEIWDGDRKMMSQGFLIKKD
jgi:hypothetical protein